MKRQNKESRRGVEGKGGSKDGVKGGEKRIEERQGEIGIGKNRDAEIGKERRET